MAGIGKRLVSGREPAKKPGDVAESRYDFLDITDAEPNLGTSANGAVLTSDIDGNRVWTANVILNTLRVEELLYPNGVPYYGSGSGAPYTLGNVAPANPMLGDRWFDTNDGFEYVWIVDGGYSAWIDGASPGSIGYTGSAGTGGSGSGGATICVSNSFTGDSSTTVFTLSQAPTDINQTLIAVGGILQPKSTYSISGTTLTFSSAPASGAPIEVTLFVTVYTVSGSATTTQQIITTNTTTSVSTTTGALKVSGGVGIAGNVNIGGIVTVSNSILPLVGNTIDIGSPTRRFNKLYLAGNTIDLGGTLISSTPNNGLQFTTTSGNIALNANTVAFLSTVATTPTADVGNLNITGSITTGSIYSNNYFYANGAPYYTAGSRGYTGSAGTNGTIGYNGSRGYTGSAGAGFTGSQGTPGYDGSIGYTGSRGSDGTSVRIIGSAATATSGAFGAVVASPVVGDGIIASDTGHLWVYSGTGPVAGFVDVGTIVGYTGSTGTNGFTGSVGFTGYSGSLGYTGSAGTIVDFSVYSGIFPSIFVDGNSAADTTYDGTVWTAGTASAGRGYAQGGMTWNATTGNITVPQTGLYQVAWTAYHTASGGETHNQRFSLRKNGVNYIAPFSHVGMDSVSTLQHTVTATINLNANDTISIAGDSSASWRPRVYGGSEHTYLQVVKISQVGYTGSVGSTGTQGSIGFTGSVGSGYTGSTGSTGVVGGVTYSVTNSGASSYTIAGSAGNPALTLIKGFTYYFTVSASGHPFWIKTASVTGTGSAYSSGVVNNGVESGTITFTVPFDAPATLYYICQYHGSMAGTITVLNSMVGFTGSTGSTGYTGSTGLIGYTGSTSEATSVTVSPIFKGALVSANATQTLSAQTHITLTNFDSVIYDTNNFRSVADRFTIPAGVTKVKLSGSLLGESATDQLICRITKNGSPTYSTSVDIDSIGQDSSVAVTPVLEVIAGDYFEFQGYSQTGSRSIVASISNWFAIEVVEGSILDTTSVIRTTGFTGSAGVIGYTGSAGSGGGGGSGTFVTRTYTGTGSQTAFSVTSGVTESSVIVTENGVVQTPTTDYTVSDTVLTFTTAPASGTAIQIREIAIAAAASVKITALTYANSAVSANTTGSETIVVTGSGFNSNATVYIDTTPCTTTYASATSLTFASPAKSLGSYMLYVYNTDGSCGVYPVGITYVPRTVSTVDSLVVAGGGGGGGNHGGGGGAGGLLYGTYSVSANTSYTITVGAGGTASSMGALGTNGNNSVFGAATALGGGRGGSYSQVAGPAAGGSGAGGTSRSGYETGASATQGNSGGLIGYGNAGGNAVTGQVEWPGGGGGGAGAVGTNASNAGKGGDGGIGREYNISGTSTYYAGGGGGCGSLNATGQQGAGGLGGGASGSVTTTPPTAATANTGGGGGGTRDGTGGLGGSGIVIIRYADTYPAASATTGSPTVTVTGGYRIYTWATSGSITF